MLAIKRSDGKYFKGRYGVKSDESIWEISPIDARLFDEDDPYLPSFLILLSNFNIKLVRLTIVEENYVRN